MRARLPTSSRAGQAMPIWPACQRMSCVKSGRVASTKTGSCRDGCTLSTVRKEWFLQCSLSRSSSTCPRRRCSAHARRLPGRAAAGAPKPGRGPRRGGPPPQWRQRRPSRARPLVRPRRRARASAAASWHLRRGGVLTNPTTRRPWPPPRRPRRHTPMGRALPRSGRCARTGHAILRRRHQHTSLRPVWALPRRDADGPVAGRHSA